MTIKAEKSDSEAPSAPGSAWLVCEWADENAAPDVVNSRNKTLFNPTTKPKTIDFIPQPQGDGVPESCLGIYKLEDETLTICYRPTSGSRPSRFTADEPGYILDVYKRKKP
jgi:uncharacterized protein (TIGR03067 family)